MVSRTPRANPAAAVINSRMASGMERVANSKWVATGSRFWTTMIATKIARQEAAMSLKFRIKQKRSLRRLLLGETPTLQGGDCWSSGNIWIDDQLNHPDPAELYFVVFGLDGRAAGTEIPLLLKQGPKSVPLLLRP